MENLPLERTDHSNQLKGTDMPYYRKKPILVEARGEFYPCQKDIFEETYEAIN